MYQPPHFREERLTVQHALMRAHPLGTLVTAGPGGLLANHIPFLLDDPSGASPLGRLRGHLARANGQWRDLDDPAARGEVLVIFQGADGYVTPSWYETKRETGKVVPTWNYAVVHAYGRARAVEGRDWLARQVAELTALREGGRAEPWGVADAPAPFIAAQLKGIVGVEVEITRVEGKWKLSQNRPEHDRRGVADGLAAEPGGDAAALAGLVREFGGL